MKKVTTLNTSPKLPKKLKVAAYARVSDGKDAMLHSLAVQVNFYKKRIKENPAWVFAGVYSDEALTGTKDSRVEFQKLLEACRLGKVDLILTKSISRFARNTVTLLETVRELRNLNIDVFFEEQNIHTLSGEGEMVLTFLASFAQEESRSVSENMKWRIKKDFEQGLIWGGNACLGYRLVNRKLQLVEDEASIVQMIYDLYLEGYSDNAIAKILNDKEIKPHKAKLWQRTSVMKLLTNYNYTGDLIIQKTYIKDHLNKQQKPNNGEMNQYLVSDAHEPIISKEVFNQAQNLRKSKSAKRKVVQNHDSPLKGLMKCGLCHKAYTIKHSANGPVWMCSTLRTKGKSYCDNKQVPNSKVIEGTNHILKQQTFNETHFKSKVKWIEVMPDKLLKFHMSDEKILEYAWQQFRSESWTKEMRVQARINRLNYLKGSTNHVKSNTDSIH